MNRIELIITLLSVCEDIADTLYTEHGFDDGDGNPIPVEMWGDADHATVPIILIDDRDPHLDESPGNNTSAGEAFNSNGEVIGERHLLSSVGKPSVVIRWPGVQTDAYRISGAIRDRLRVFAMQPDRFADHAPTNNSVTLTETPVREFAVESTRQRDVEYRSANDVHQHEVALRIHYTDVIVDRVPEPLDGFHTDFDMTMDGSIEESAGVGTITVAEGETYTVSVPYFQPDTLIVDGTIVYE